jgi:hypothetical protein
VTRYQYPLEPFVTVLIVVFALVVVLIYGGPIERHSGIAEQITLDVCAPRDESPNRAAARRAECDDSEDLPGRFVASQGRSHTPAWPLSDRDRVPFCDDDNITSNYYASNPPTSGLHLPTAQSVAIDGEIIRLPPDPGIYDIEIPREAIPHLQEHAGVFVGYNCESTECFDAYERVRAVVAGELRSGARVILAPSSDLLSDTIALAAWTRVDVMPAADYEDARARDFIETHSCRFDPEGFCGEAAPRT